MNQSLEHTLAQLSPYLNAHRDKTFVIHLDDSLWHRDDFANVCQEIALLNSLNVKTVLILGNLLHREIVTAEMLASLQYNAYQQLEKLYTTLSSGTLNRPSNTGQIKVVTGNIVKARAMGVLDGVDYQWLGKARQLDTQSIEQWLQDLCIVAVPAKGYSVSGEVYALDSRELACQIAQQTQAEKLIFMASSAHLSAVISPDADKSMTLNTLLQANGETANGFFDDSAESFALQRLLLAYPSEHLKRIHLILGEQGSLTKELFTPDGTGYMIAADSYDELRTATLSDIPGILALIQPMEASGALVVRPREQIEREYHHFTVLMRDNTPIGCVALYPYEQMAELACFVISPDYHHRGLAKLMLKQVSQKAVEQGINQLFVLTTQTSHWFEEQGFEHASLDNLPTQKQLFYNWQRQSKVLIKSLK